MMAGWVLVLALAVQQGGERLLEEANRRKAAGDLRAAGELLGRAADAGPLAPEARSLLVELLLRQQDAEAARSAALAGLQQAPEAAYLRLCLGDACWLLRDLPGADEQYRRVAASGGEFAGAARQRLDALAEDLALARRAADLEARSQWLAAAAALALVLAAAAAARVAGAGTCDHSPAAE